ncbi:MAG: pyridoxamine 5'-phosphate oxidase family protein [Bdellovibrionales bacterium]
MIPRHRHVGILGPRDIKEVLESCQNGHLGCWAHGEGYVVPITYVYSNGWIYGHTREGKKIEMMRTNPDVCLQVEEMKSRTEWRSVIAWGKFHELKNERAAEAMRVMIMKVGGSASSLESDFASILEESIIYGIEITKSTGRWEDSQYFPA